MIGGDRSNRIAIAFEPDRCLHAKSAWADCSLCIDSCPGEAVRIREGARVPSVDLDRCVHCGQCLAACPLEAFESPRFTERQLLRRIEPDAPVRLRCFLPYGELDALDSELETYQLGTCLAALSPGAMFSLAQFRSCELATDRCASCSLLPWVGQTMRCNVVSAYYMLCDWGSSGNLVETEPLFLPVGREEASSGSPCAPIASRAVDDVRSSIRSLFHGRKKNAVASKALLPLRSKKKHVPLWRQRLQAEWEKRDGAASCVCAWPVLEVDATLCRACGICMQLCPTGSIRHAMGDGTFSYSFVPGTCVNCGLCIASCSAGALSRDYRVFERPFDELVCFSKAAEPCPRCGMPVLDPRDGALCPLCSSEPDLPSLIERVREQMASATRSARSGEKVKRP